MAQQPKLEITVTSQYEYVTYPAPSHPVVMVAVTYQRGLLPPRTVFIEKDKLNDVTLKDAIKHDLDQSKAQAPRTLEI